VDQAAGGESMAGRPIKPACVKAPPRIGFAQSPNRFKPLAEDDIFKRCRP